MKILFTGGGSGGHIFPIVAIVRELRKIRSNQDLEFLFVGPKDEWASNYIIKEGVEVKTIFAGKIRRYLTPDAIFQNIVDIFFKIPLGIIQAFFCAFFWNPDLIFSKGGFGSIPIVIAGWVLQIPIFLHESDKDPGLSNRFLAKLSLQVFTSFQDTERFPKDKIIVVGNPIRKELLKGSLREAREYFRIRNEKPVILVLGGSQGAQRINDLVLQILTELLYSFEVIHQTGKKNFEQVKKEADVMIAQRLKQFYHPFPFFEEKEFSLAYVAAHLVISRAGATTIFAIASLGKPSVLVPLAGAAQNHQVKNAYAFAKNGAALVIEEANFTPRFFLEKLKHLLTHPGELEHMSQKAREFAKPEAARIIAHYIVDYLSR